jgi:hypothetical protein
MKNFFGSGKSVSGMIICASGAIAGYFGLDHATVLLIESLGCALFGVGVSHKVQKLISKTKS